MARTIEFDAQALIGKIDALRGAQLPFAGNRALRQLGFQLRGELQKEMRDKFQNPVPFTINSPRYRVDGLELTVSISKDGAKGQDPARYLYPVTAEGGVGGSKPAYITRFTKGGACAGDRGCELLRDPVPAGSWCAGECLRQHDAGAVPAELQGLKTALALDGRVRSGGISRCRMVGSLVSAGT
jgi:hypothetical protein